jgi:hypothetical protein
MTRYTGPPMDLTNMRSLGVTKVDVYCGCGHQALYRCLKPTRRPGGAPARYGVTVNLLHIPACKCPG